MNVATRSALAPLAVVIAVSGASAQQDYAPFAWVTTPIRYAGVYHVASGTWTSTKPPVGDFGIHDLYDNTCTSPYYVPYLPGQTWTDSGRIPGADSPYPNKGACTGVDVYRVDGFRIGWCTDLPGATSTPPGPGIDISVALIDHYNINCTTGPPPADHVVALTGLPGAGPALSACWIADIDLIGTPPFFLSSDGDGQFDNSATLDNFAYQLTIGNVGASTQTGILYGGDPALCGFGDSTYYKAPVHPAGTGLGQGDFFWVAGGGITPGCTFGTGYPDFPWSGLRFRIYGNVDDCVAGIGSTYCAGDGTSGSCPCGNVGAYAQGCAHSMGSSGGHLFGTGDTSFAADDFVLTAENLPGHQFALVFVGSSGTSGVGTPLFDGLLCVGGSLHRYGVQNTGPNPASIVQTQPIASSGGLISAPGQSWYFQSWFRNAPASTSSCGSGANLTNGRAVTFGP